jgi:hypothetical protein
VSRYTTAVTSILRWIVVSSRVSVVVVVLIVVFLRVRG